MPLLGVCVSGGGADGCVWVHVCVCEGICICICASESQRTILDIILQVPLSFLKQDLSLV